MENIDKQKKTKQRKPTLFGILKCILSALILITAITYTSLEISDLKSEDLEDMDDGPNCEPMEFWSSCWGTGIASTSKREYSKKINVYFGQNFRELLDEQIGEDTDLNQILTLTLVRNVAENFVTSPSQIIKTPIYSFDSSLSYFLGKDFYYMENYFTDTITISNLYNSKKEGVITYDFTIFPKNQDELKFYPKRYIARLNTIESAGFQGRILYSIDFRGKIAFEIAEREEEGVKY